MCAPPWPWVAGVPDMCAPAHATTDVPTEKPMVSQPNDSLISRLEQLKQALDTGLISQSDYNAAKNKALGI